MTFKSAEQKSAYMKDWWENNKHRISQYQTDRWIKTQSIHRALKRELVDSLGGKCVLCGYSRALAALDFDHLEPTNKTKEVSRLISEHKYDEAREEAKKCRLLCSNCHREHTFGEY